MLADMFCYDRVTTSFNVCFFSKICRKDILCVTPEMLYRYDIYRIRVLRLDV